MLPWQALIANIYVRTRLIKNFAQRLNHDRAWQPMEIPNDGALLQSSSHTMHEFNSNSEPQQSAQHLGRNNGLAFKIAQSLDAKPNNTSSSIVKNLKNQI